MPANENPIPCRHVSYPCVGLGALRLQTKQRADLIPNADELCRDITGVAKAKNITLLAAGGTSNHIHLLIAVPPTIPLARAVQELKGNSSRWLRGSCDRLSLHLPAAMRFLGLLPGCRFLLAYGHLDVWFDGSLLDIQV